MAKYFDSQNELTTFCDRSGEPDQSDVCNEDTDKK